MKFINILILFYQRSLPLFMAILFVFGLVAPFTFLKPVGIKKMVVEDVNKKIMVTCNIV